MHAERGELERILRNLLDNAVRHAAHRIELTIRTEGADVVAEVRDDGPGIPAADIERVFDRFTRLDDARARDYGGAGLGLAIARDLAHRRQGTLTLTPPTGPTTTGARFVLLLPHAEGPQTPATPCPVS